MEAYPTMLYSKYCSSGPYAFIINIISNIKGEVRWPLNRTAAQKSELPRAEMGREQF